jgi:hypothetical protein
MKNEIKTEIKKLLESKFLKILIYILGVLIIVVLIFQAGFYAGFRKASFGREWGNHYFENFGPRHDRGGMPIMMEFPNPNGANGKIIKIELPTIIVQDRDNTEKVVLLEDDTKIISQKQDISVKDLKIDDFVVIIGNPNNKGQIEAKLIRIMPVPPELSNNKEVTN